MKWFRTYTEGAAPQPIYCSTSDASVYDLKDHPDFKYRPGSIVIRYGSRCWCSRSWCSRSRCRWCRCRWCRYTNMPRVMNKAGDDCGLGAGQVLENQPSGQVGHLGPAHTT